MKFKRHSTILNLIESRAVETQNELLELLLQAGYDVTQATISRDIKELRLIKTLDREGRYRYSVGGSENREDYSLRFRNIFRESVIAIDNAMNLVVIKTPPGVASAAAAAVDAMSATNIVGSIAGDDTIFLAMRSIEDAADFCREIENMLK